MAQHNPPVGHLIGPDEQRDAIHIAIAPVIAGETLQPGRSVFIRSDGRALASAPSTCVGIVDPFLKGDVREGERFFVFLTPYTVTSLRHHWEHPAFDKAPALDPKAEALKRVRELADELGLHEMALIAAAQTYAEFGEGTYTGEFETYGGTDAQWEQFWKDAKVLYGIEIKNKDPYYGDRIPFYCAC